jgi:hypothetical protein
VKVTVIKASRVNTMRCVVSSKGAKVASCKGITSLRPLRLCVKPLTTSS